MGTAAIIGSAVIGAGTSLIAADKQSDAASAAAGLQAQQGQQIRSDLGPFREVGEAALFELAALQGLPVNFPGSTIDQAGNPVGGSFRGGADSIGDRESLPIPPGEEPVAFADPGFTIDGVAQTLPVVGNFRRR